MKFLTFVMCAVMLLCVGLIPQQADAGGFFLSSGFNRGFNRGFRRSAIVIQPQFNRFSNRGFNNQLQLQNQLLQQQLLQQQLIQQQFRGFSSPQRFSGCGF